MTRLISLAMALLSCCTAFAADKRVTAAGAGNALEPWASKARPSDVARNHVVDVTSAEHKYVVLHGGTMDGTNCRTPMGTGMNREGAIEQTWQSNRAVRMENVGQTDVVDPWLSDGRNNFRNIKELVASAVAPGMSDAEKARALWYQQIRHRYHSSAGGEDLGDPVKVFNVYGLNPCGKDAMMMGGLWKQVGLKGAPVRLVGHAIAQVHYDGDWHVMDGDLGMIYLLRDNQTLASDRQLARDHDLVKRTHTMGLLVDDSRARDEHAAAMFVSEEPIQGSRACKADTTMSMTLRPGEALVWRWGHKPAKHVSPNQFLYPDNVCNGLWEYRPDFAGAVWKKGATKVENVAAGPDGLAAQDGKTGTVVWRIASPYAFVGGHLEADAAGAKFSVSPDGAKWTDIPGGNFDKFFPLEGNPYYQYQLRCELPAGAKLKRLAIVNDLQMALLALPEMTVGQNTFTYTDKSGGERNVRITHEWVERSTSKPPAAPAAVYPPDGGRAEGTDFAFRWRVPEDPDGDRITDYHFVLADRPDVRWPLSTNFEKLISRTADKGKAQYTLPGIGLLTGDATYYWRVRAKDEKGVWGPWSKTFNFTPKAPNYPVDVALGYDDQQEVGVLKWKANPAGEKPVNYRVYGSDEKGFSVSDVPYKVSVATSKELKPEFPANFIAETSATELAVMGGGVESPDANKTYYRVVAVDAQGQRSGPSDYATAPRPTIYGRPVTRAKVGTEYRCPLHANRSLGDLQLRMVGGKETANFWDVEKPRFALDAGPAWLKIDPATGLLSGTPDAAGKVDVAVTVTIDRDVRKLDDGRLGWGVEKVISTSTERVGSATRKYSIEISN
ncbi:MAG TPA: Ig domain-containing protein [Tepidisphaeraceae bacterium]|nr:Ig domain-containing protein [Tepidisphaeraceae bacterium]